MRSAFAADATVGTHPSKARIGFRQRPTAAAALLIAGLASAAFVPDAIAQPSVTFVARNLGVVGAASVDPDYATQNDATDTTRIARRGRAGRPDTGAGVTG